MFYSSWWVSSQPAINDEEPEYDVATDAVRDPGAAFLRHRAAVLGGDTTRAAAATPPAASTPAAAGRRHAAHSHMEAAAWQVSVLGCSQLKKSLSFKKKMPNDMLTHQFSHGCELGDVTFVFLCYLGEPEQSLPIHVVFTMEHVVLVTVCEYGIFS